LQRPPVARLVALLCAMCVAFGAIFVRLTVLQVSQAAALQDRAMDQRLRTVALPPARGRILDSSGEAMALTLPARDVYADPRFVAEPWSTATALAPLLGVDASALLRSLTADASFVYLRREVGLQAAREVAALDLPGIGLTTSSRRYYPAGDLAAQILGFVGIDGEGLAGLELQYQRLLAGTPGERTQELDPLGKPIAGGVNVQRDPVAGSSIVTTIDRDLQFQAQAALEHAVVAQRARGGTVVVMDPRSGDLLAVASYPWFDPNDFTEARPGQIRARAITDAYEPGSTNKVITAAAAVQDGAIALDRVLDIPWEMDVDEFFTIHDAERHPLQRMTLADIIARSSNVGAAKVASLVGAWDLASYLARFGLGRRTGVGFPGESNGVMLPLYRWGTAALATIAYGQGIAATPLQMTSVFATIANGGRLLRPRLVAATIDPDGTRRDLATPPGRRVVSAETARTVSQMLAYAVEHGTGRNAEIAGYQVAGKTGTSRIPLKDRPGYVSGQYVASFIGYLPAGKPQVVIAAILDRPAEGYGGIAAAPLFRDVAKAAIARLRIQPADPLPSPTHALPAP
jgi:cell division protein FtsI (penicillin-binding protein 3)